MFFGIVITFTFILRIVEMKNLAVGSDYVGECSSVPWIALIIAIRVILYSGE